MLDFQNTPLAGALGIRDLYRMRTNVDGYHDTDSSMPARPRRLPVDWTESEWFHVWLKLARHEYDGAADRPIHSSADACGVEAAC
jgi:hypothetical protein